MKKVLPSNSSLDLRGLALGPSQIWGSVRLVPLLRKDAPGDLRLGLRPYAETATLVSLGEAGSYFASYVPHGLVVSWSDDGSPVAALGTRLDLGKDKAPPPPRRRGRSETPPFVQVLHRMVKREGGQCLRMLPLHLAMEGFLALYLGGPDIAWKGYTSGGLAFRSEIAWSGRAIADLEEALRLFEIHERQCGALLFVADALASAFVVSHPEDYRLLHDSVIEDFFGLMLVEYGRLYRHLQPFALDLGSREVLSMPHLRDRFATGYRELCQFHDWMAGGLIGRPIGFERVYTAGPFRLERFMTELRPDAECHFGERIVREDGSLEYLKTYRLSRQQARRAHLLRLIAGHDWNLPAAAQAERQTPAALMRRLLASGFGYLFKPDYVKSVLKSEEPRA